MNLLTEPISLQLEVLEDTRDGTKPFRFRGTALVQGGLSRNGRYYPPGTVTEAVRRAQNKPLTVYARHRDALEGTGLPVGRVDRVYLEGTALKYEATLAPTRLGRDLQALVEGGFITGASVRARPYASHRVRLGEREVEWVDSLTLRGIDFTNEPGVPEAAGFEVLAESAFTADPSEGEAEAGEENEAASRPLEEESMDLQSLDLETLRAERPDLVRALCEEASAVLEEARRVLEVVDGAAVPGAVRELMSARTRAQIAELVEGELRGDPARRAILERLVEECANVSEARARLEKERAYALALRRSLLPAGVAGAGEAPGAGLTDNPEDAALDPERAHARRMAGVPVVGS